MRFSTSLVAVAVLLAPVKGIPMPSGIPDLPSAKSELDGLTVAKSLSGSGYSRSQFEHWHTVSGACNTRETVLQRDGQGVVTDKSCQATSGSWYSPYDNKTSTKASGVDIDHMVPLKNAWVSGARSWDNKTREEFANDLVRPQLWAVTDKVNQEKSDQSPDRWKPPVATFYCTYASSWITVKKYWNLTITTPEKTALTDMLATCTAPSPPPPPSGGSNTTGPAASLHVGDSAAIAISLGMVIVQALF